MKPLIVLSKMLSDLGQVSGRDSSPPSLILVLSRVAIDFNQHLTQSLVYFQFSKPVCYSRFITVASFTYT